MKGLGKMSADSVDEYLELVGAHPLRVIRGDREHQEAIAVLSRVAGGTGAKLSDGARHTPTPWLGLLRIMSRRHTPRC